MNRLRYALASLCALLVFSAASQAQSNPPVFNGTENYKIGDLVTYQGVTFQCLINETTTHPNPHSLYWGINYVYSGALPIPVGPSETIKTLTQAWTYISGARIANNSSITIELQSNYTETFTSSFSLNHPFGSKIFIVGTGGAQATFSNKTAGFTLNSGFHLADLEGLVIVGANGGSGDNPAIHVSQNSCLAQLRNMTFYRFDVDLFADSGEIDNISNIQCSQFVDTAISATNNATINVSEASPITVDGSTTNTQPSCAFYASFGATINCYKCTGENCHFSFYATLGARINAGSTISNNTSANIGAGYCATERGYIYADASTSSGGLYGYDCATGGYISASGSNSSGEGTNDYIAMLGGIINARSFSGGSNGLTGTNDGSYIYGLP
jgi:hypothetical protein